MSIVGIDLGTTNSLVACFINNESVIIPNAFGENLTPSVVSVLESGEIITGKAARERLITHPELSAATFKRYMGTEKKYKLGRHTFTPIDLSSFILKALKADAESYLKESVTEAVISVPAYFNDEQRRATKQAAQLAGLKVERLINEPTASALAYGLHQNMSESKFLIFDLGGGTFDVSILDSFEDIMEVSAVSGNNFLGGEDFTELLMNQFLKSNNINLSSLNIKEISAIKKKAEECKLQLSETDKADIQCVINNQSYNLKISNNEFEGLSAELLEKLKKPVVTILKDSSIYSNQLDNIVLVGGSTKMPIIRKFIVSLFGRFPLCSLNPDEVVALGASIYAAMKERNETLREKVLTDVCPYTLGTEIAVMHGDGYENGHYCPIIERNTTIPCSKVVRLWPLYENQTRMLINVFQGESRLVDNNVKIGELNVNFRGKTKMENAVDVRYTYDINGILEVETIIVSTKEKRTMIIKNANTTMSSREIEKRFKELADLKIHPRDKEKNRYLLDWGNRLYEEALSDERTEIEMLLTKFEAILDEQNPEKIKFEAALLEQFFKSIDRSGF